MSTNLQCWKSESQQNCIRITCWEVKVNNSTMLGKWKSTNLQKGYMLDSESLKIFNVGLEQFNKFLEGLHVGKWNSTNLQCWKVKVNKLIEGLHFGKWKSTILQWWKSECQQIYRRVIFWEVEVNKYIMLGKWFNQFSMLGKWKSTNLQCWESKIQQIQNVGKVKVNKFIMLGMWNSMNLQCWESGSQQI